MKLDDLGVRARNEVSTKIQFPKPVTGTANPWDCSTVSAPHDLAQRVLGTVLRDTSPNQNSNPSSRVGNL